MFRIEIFLASIAYLVGSIPTGYWFTRLFFGVDVTKRGSGNIGATNVARVLGDKRYFFIIFLIDFLKAFFTLYVSSIFLPIDSDFLLVIAALLLLGNSYSIFLKFRGGKGVSTFLGILAFLFFELFIFFVALWVCIILFFDAVDKASLIAAASILPYAICFVSRYYDIFALTFLFFAVIFIFWRHRQNLKHMFS
jgi:acyl phosphate:glycerol-3-phosphate acyltransferase